MKNFENKYDRAKKRVDELKSFYRHLRVFILINGIFLIFRFGGFNSFIPDWLTSEPQFFNWVDVNLLIWGGILFIHLLYIYRHKFPYLKNWEENKIQKLMEEEKEKTKKYR